VVGVVWNPKLPIIAGPPASIKGEIVAEIKPPCDPWPSVASTVESGPGLR
jgi:hypothetical protein